jgi:hypothetical protein
MDVEMIKTLIVILFLFGIIVWFYIFVCRLLDPFYYKISWITTDNTEHCLYVKLLKEMSLTTYEEIPLNIIEHYNSILALNVIKESIKIERIYIERYTDFKLFDKKFYS